MINRELGRSRRRGAVTVETAFVMILLTTLIFGVFEYGRLLMDWSLLGNAGREGCRYALANNTNATIGAEVNAIVTSFMAGEAASFTNFTVTVTGTHLGASTPVNNLAADDMITVTVTGNYKFLNIVPLIPMPASFSMTSSVTMACEGAM